MKETLIKYLPFFLPIAGAAVLVLIKSAFKRLNEEISAIIGALSLAGAVFLLWQAFVGGTSSFDNMSLVSSMIISASALLAVILSVNCTFLYRLPSAEFVALILFATFGALVMVSFGDLVAIFIGMEVLSLSAYVMAGLDGKNVLSLEASIKYFTLGAFASAILLFGIALYYGSTGEFQISNFKSQISDPILYHLATAFIFAGFAFKAALVPFQWWVPDVYQGAPLPSTTFFATTVKSAAVIVLFRVMAAATTDNSNIFGWLAVATMIIGNLAAIRQEDTKRMLAYSSIAHAGYMLLAFVYMGSFPGSARSAILFYLIVYILMTAGAFSVLSYLSAGTKKGFEDTHLSKFAGLSRRNPFIAAAFAVFMLSLTGFPPFGGFLAKYFLFRGLVDAGHVVLAVIGVMNSLVSAYYYMRPVVRMYFGEAARDAEPKVFAHYYSMMGVMAFCAIATFLIGIFPNVILAIVQK